MIEIWKDIKEFNGKYKISNTGKVKGVKKILKTQDNGKGYSMVTLSCVNNNIKTKKTIAVHRLVAVYFVDGYSKNLTVNHIDGNKLNNNFKNLEWITNKENIRHSFRIGLRKSKYNENHHRTKVSTEIIKNIRELYKKGLRQCEICKIHNLSPRYINDIVKNKRRKG